ncbi:MAG: LPS assembly protein LptD [Steroidobacteraceae bacterium]
MASYVRAALAAILCLLAISRVRAGDMCPAPPKRHAPTAAAAAAAAAGDHLVRIESDGASVDAQGSAVLTGHVQAHQDARSVAADSVTYDEKTGKLTVTGAVDFEDPRLRVRSDSGVYDALGGASFDKANFQIFERNGRGYAQEMSVHPDGKVNLEKVRYTTCPVGNQDWMLQASSISLDTNREQGTAHGVVMRFKDVPIFYSPYLAFPIGPERQSGVLFPSFGHSGQSGYQLEVPYYFNLAPNYDLTLTPGYLSERGVQLGGEFRFLTASSKGQIEENFLPNDALAHSDRAYVHLTDITDLKPGLRLDADIASVSDSSYFENFGAGTDQTSVTFLERRADLLYYDDAWRVRAQLQNFQTIDTSVDAGDRPYSRVPRVEAVGLWPILDSKFEFFLDSEATNFVREVGPAGVRVALSPEIRWSDRTAGYFFEPAIGYHFLQYDLQNASYGEPSTPTLTVPYARLDTGLIFERDAGSSGQFTQTLEPRMVYSYVPYRNQNELPVFDTGTPDFNLVELYRTNRYVGSDRFGDADQVAIGMTTRLINQTTGAQYLSATVGQIRYLTLPEVTLPGETPQSTHGSDIISEVSLTAYKHWTVNLDYQVNPDTAQTDKSEVLIQYRPDPSEVVNLGYRFQQNILKQYDGSFAWPIASHWNTVGRWVYSLQDHQTIEQLAGIEYKSCCWRIQVLQRRYVINRNGGLDTSIALQLELTGLSSVGKPANAFLSKEISGYSARDPNAE